MSFPVDVHRVSADPVRRLGRLWTLRRQLVRLGDSHGCRRPPHPDVDDTTLFVEGEYVSVTYAAECGPLNLIMLETPRSTTLSYPTFLTDTGGVPPKKQNPWAETPREKTSSWCSRLNTG